MNVPGGAAGALLLFGGFLLLCMAPAGLAARRDPRTLRGVSVWAKPLKFMAALALFSITTAVLMQAAGDTPATQAALWRIAALVTLTAGFEVAYISFQASRGQASHYNTSDTFHAAMTALMALGAIALVASQAWLAIVIVAANPAWQSSVAVLGAVTGLLMTALLSAVSGFLLGARRAPAGPGLALFGWQRRGDLRPAHFLAVHAQQCIPLAGLLAAFLPGRAMQAGLFGAATAAYLLAWAALTLTRLGGARIAPPA